MLMLIRRLLRFDGLGFFAADDDSLSMGGMEATEFIRAYEMHNTVTSRQHPLLL